VAKRPSARRFLNELDPERYDTGADPKSAHHGNADAQGHSDGAREKKLARSQNDLVAQVNQALLDRISKGRDIVLIIDEAQNLSFEVLEQIRLLSNLETDKQKLLQIVLMDSRNSKPVLAREELRQLRQRILVHYELHALSLTDMQHYIHHAAHACPAGSGPSVTHPVGASLAASRQQRGFPAS